MSPVLAGNAQASALGDVTNRGRTFTISVDPFEVEHMLDIVMAQLAGYKLAIWLREKAHHQLSEEIFDRFARRGDEKSGDWAPLTDTTQDIRRALGYNGADPINVRTGDMFLFLTEHYELDSGDDWAELTVPGDTSDAVLVRKIETAQEGRSGSENPLFSGDTPPRPVLAAPDDADVQELLESLQAEVMLSVAGALL